MRSAAWLGLAIGLACMTGCVERRFVITTTPPGAIVYDEKHLPTGAAPTDREFTYYGKYRFTLVKDGFQTMVVEENVKSPWYEFIGLDFISENLIPWTIRDVRRFHYTLMPAQMIPEDEILQKAGLVRQKGKEVGEPLPVAFPEAAPAPGTLPRTSPVPPAPVPGTQPQTPPISPAPAPGAQPKTP